MARVQPVEGVHLLNGTFGRETAKKVNRKLRKPSDAAAQGSDQSQSEGAGSASAGKGLDL